MFRGSRHGSARAERIGLSPMARKFYVSDGHRAPPEVFQPENATWLFIRARVRALLASDAEWLDFSEAGFE